MYWLKMVSLLGFILMPALAMVGCTAEQQENGPYVGSVDDFMQISQLYSHYNFTIDNGDGDA